jgi:hypothetical protein
MPTDLRALIAERRTHLTRFANQGGREGEVELVTGRPEWLERPRGRELKALLRALDAAGTPIKGSSFDAIALPAGLEPRLHDSLWIDEHLAAFTFVEIKTSNQPRVGPGFSGFFFALTEGEIEAAAVLGSRHRVALYNKRTGELLITSVEEILARASSRTWQLSVSIR